MIGGTDLVLTGASTSHDADLILRTVWLAWPDAWLQCADSSQARPLSQAFPIVGFGEFIVYRDRSALDSWRAHGAAPDNGAAVLNVIVDINSVTIIVDDSASSLAASAREILDALPCNRITLDSRMTAA